uniref:Chromosome 11 open reading frame 97 n=1 Tax=Cyanoderma ruficeps TaxID=181631 RepID=A0A8C3RBC2_9PASS
RRGGPACRAAWQPRCNRPAQPPGRGGHEGGGLAGVRGGRGAGQRWQKCVYVEPPRRVKEILEEHFHFQKEECNVKHPAAALEGVWNVKNNFSIRSLKPVSPNSNDLLLQPQFYSRHARMKSKSQ